MMLSLYRGLTTLGGPLITLYLRRRAALGKEDAGRSHERRGRPDRPRPPGPLVWLHAASVGESLSMLPLIERIATRPALSVLVTTGTVTSARLMAERLPAGAFHQYAPIDRLDPVRRFLDHWRPDLALWAESEFWPNLVAETAARGVPMVLLNGRVSARSFHNWKRLPGLARRLLGGFALCLGQTDADAARLATLGAPRVACRGNLKFAVPPLPGEPAMLQSLRDAVSGRPLWLAASTHAGEEAITAAVHLRLAPTHRGLLSVIVPRHPQRGPAIATELRDAGLAVALRSRGEPIGAATDVYVADTMGELGLFYRLCPLAFIGKSLAGVGGQNPLEPARLGCAVVFGPHMSNFDEIARRMHGAGAAVMIEDAASLGATVGRLLADEAERTALARAGITFAMAEAGVLDAVLTDLAPFLAAAEARHAAA